MQLYMKFFIIGNMIIYDNTNSAAIVNKIFGM